MFDGGEGLNLEYEIPDKVGAGRNQKNKALFLSFNFFGMSKVLIYKLS
jgi:hypothetical protein